MGFGWAFSFRYRVVSCSADTPSKDHHNRGMVAGHDDLRRCVCCGEPTPSRTMCACWRHWMMLPEDLRSELLKSYGRGQLASYRHHLLKAVEIWRQRGVWHVPFTED